MCGSAVATARGSVTLNLEPATEGRNRLTVAFRPILAIPHLILVGAFDAGARGALGLVAATCALISWFAILFTGRQPQGLWDLTAFYLRWRARGVSYAALLRDEYPPFGEGPYPASLELRPPEGARDRVRVGFRPILVIPHFIVLIVLIFAWVLTSVIAWFAILFTGRYPVGLAGFGVGVLRWTLRVEAYSLLLVDAYPPFSLQA